MIFEERGFNYMLKRTQPVSILIITLMFLLNFNEPVNCYIVDNPLKTKIKDISWEKKPPTYMDNHTHFEFTINFDITNPTNESVTLSYPYAGCQFYGNFKVIFYNLGIEALNHTYYGGLCVVGEREFQPGTENEDVYYIMGFEEENMTRLPDGHYTIWVASYNYGDNVHHNYAYIRIVDGISTISYEEELPTLEISNNYNAFLTSLFVVLLCIGFTKRKKNSKKY